MSSSTFAFAFEGETFDGGEIDVRDLAPALLSLGEIIQTANRALNGNRAQASLRMKATNLGSFEALLSVDISFLTSIGDMLDAITDNPDRVVAANQLLDLVLKAGGGGTATVVGLLGVLKWLQGRKAEQIEPQPNGTVIIVKDGGSAVIDQRTLVLLNDIATREAVEDFGRKALGVAGVSSIRLSEVGAKPALILEKSDIASLKVPDPSVADPLVQKVEREVLLRIVTSAFREGYKWRFSDGGEKPFTAAMEDLDFINTVSRGKTPLSANDILRCLIREEQMLGAGGLSKEVAVIRVLEHIPGPSQLKLI